MRGRKPHPLPPFRESAFVEIYPREGTETFCHFCHPPSRELKFIPVRGRKRLRMVLSQILRVEIYPREGTETRMHVMNEMEQEVEIYPREGTETILCASFKCHKRG